MKNNIIKEFIEKTGIGFKQLIKAMIFSSLINFLVLLFGLKIANIPHYILISLVISIIDLLPVIGAGIVLIPWSVVAFFNGDTKLVLILLLLFIITFILKQILEPIILGKSVGLKPMYSLIITIICMVVFTPAIGALVGAIVSVIVSVLMDLKKELYEE
ncbi:putative PurR-regulated permease PerM [Peptoniphilus olsenii]|uniref:PurR-regulated permease PerM n=1 Tax=Peptoniphilus olsenii TaxID=411570 RepID=A0ABV2J6V9_9FIRM